MSQYLKLTELEVASINFGHNKELKPKSLKKTAKLNRYWLYSRDSEVGMTSKAFLRSPAWAGELSFLGVEGLIVGLDFVAAKHGAGLRIIGLLNEGISNMGISINLHADIYKVPARKSLLNAVKEFLAEISTITEAPVIVFAPSSGFETFLNEISPKIQVYKLNPNVLLSKSKSSVEAFQLGGRDKLIFTLEKLVPAGFRESNTAQRKLIEVIGDKRRPSPGQSTSSAITPILFEPPRRKNIVARLGETLSPYPKIYGFAEKSLLFMRRIGGVK